MASIFTLNEIQYSDKISASLRLYVFDEGGKHSGGQWFRKVPQYLDEEIPSADAKQRVDEAEAEGLEVRICNSGDFCVYHSIGGVVQFPSDIEAFWRTVLGYPFG